MRSPRSRALLCAIGVALASACGPAPPPHAATVRPAGSTTEAAAPVRSLRAGTSGDYPPLSTWADGRPGGFAPALLEAFVAPAQVQIAWTRFKWPDLLSDVAESRFDVAADGITVRPERSIVGRYTLPIARGGVVLLLRRPPWATSTDVGALDRRELRVAVNAGGHLEAVTRRLFKAATILPIADNAVRDVLARGGADAAMTNTFEAPRWSAGLDGIERVGPLTRDTTALWVRGGIL